MSQHAWDSLCFLVINLKDTNFFTVIKGGSFCILQTVYMTWLLVLGKGFWKPARSFSQWFQLVNGHRHGNVPLFYPSAASQPFLCSKCLSTLHCHHLTEDAERLKILLNKNVFMQKGKKTASEECWNVLMPSLQDGIGQHVHSTVPGNKKRKMRRKKEPLLIVVVHY